VVQGAQDTRSTSKRHVPGTKLHSPWIARCGKAMPRFQLCSPASALRKSWDDPTRTLTRRRNEAPNLLALICVRPTEVSKSHLVQHATNNVPKPATHEPGVCLRNLKLAETLVGVSCFYPLSLIIARNQNVGQDGCYRSYDSPATCWPTQL
jgi:hypothetical protein